MCFTLRPINLFSVLIWKCKFSARHCKEDFQNYPHIVDALKLSFVKASTAARSRLMLFRTIVRVSGLDVH
jgi:hypothetical protein